MSAFGYTRYGAAFGVAVNDAGTRIADKPLSCVDRLAANLFEWVEGIDLKSAFRFVYPFVGGTAVSHSFNLADPTTGRIDWQGTLTHNASGVTGDGVTGKGRTNMGLAGVTAADTQVNLGIYLRTASTATQQDIGLIIATTVDDVITETPVSLTDIGIICRWSDGYAYYYNTGFVNVAVPNSQGLFSNLRTNLHYVYRNGVYLSNNATYNGPPDAAAVFYILDGGHLTAAPSARNVAFAFLTNAYRAGPPAFLPGIGDQAGLYNLIQSFQTKLGRQV